MDETLSSMLAPRRTHDSDNYTIKSYYSPEAYYQLDPVDQIDFWYTYCEKVRDERFDPSTWCLNLGERVDKTCCIISEIKLAFSPPTDLQRSLQIEDVLDELFIVTLVSEYQMAIRQVFTITDPALLMCIVLQQDELQIDNDKVILRLRLQFPHAVAEVQHQMKYLRPALLSKLKEGRSLSNLLQQPLGMIEDTVRITIDEPIPLYRSIKEPDAYPLSLLAIYPEITAVMIEQSGLSIPQYELDQAFNPSYHSLFTQVDWEQMNNDERLDFFLPLFLSVNYYKASPLTRNTGVLRTPRSILTTNSSAKTVRLDDKDEDDLTLLREFVDMLPKMFWQEEIYYRELGMALFNATDGSPEGFKEWVRVGELLGRVEDHEVMDFTYQSFFGSHITYKSIAWYAKINPDSQVAYSKWNERRCRKAMDMALSGLDNDIAQAFFCCYWLEYLYTVDGKSDRWYHFENHRWKPIPNGLEITKKMSEEFYQLFIGHRYKIVKELESVKDRDKQKILNEKVNLVTKLLDKLKSSAPKSKALKELRGFFVKDDFNELKDMSDELTCMTNCVIQVYKERVIQRPGKPEDYCTKCTMIRYPYSYTWKHPRVVQLMDWMNKVYPDKELFHYVMKYFSSHLRSGNIDKIFAILTGDTNNSKTQVSILFDKAFGQYSCEIPTTVLTRKAGDAGAASPQLARTIGGKVAKCEEPSDNEKFESSFIKAWASTGSLFLRFLFDNGGQFRVTAKLNVFCNKIPPCFNAGTAFYNRVVVIPHLSTWVDNPPDTEEEQYHQRLFRNDPYFSEKIPSMAEAFIWVLVQYYPIYVRERLIKPKIVLDVSRQYKENNDLYSQYVSNRIDKSFDEGGRPMTGFQVTCNDIVVDYARWFKRGNVGKECADRQSIIDAFNKMWGHSVNGVWYGYSLKEDKAANPMSSFMMPFKM